MSQLRRADLETILRAARADPQPLIENCFKIRTKDLRVVPFKLNPCQQALHDVLQRQHRAGKPMRAVVLKARQLGCSVYLQARMLATMLAYPGTRALVTAHERDASQELLSLSQRFMLTVDEDLTTNFTDSLNRITLKDIPTVDGAHVIGSTITVETATGKEAARGKTVQLSHCSEAAFYPEAKKTMRGILGAVPKTVGTLIVLESTANGVVGVGEEYHARWQSAESGDSEFAAVFLPWYMNPEYATAPPMGMRYTAEEVELAARFKLTPHQIAWRRGMITSDFNGSIEEFQTEYPATPAEAFMRSGGPLFPVSVLIEYREKAQAAAYRDGYTDGRQFHLRQGGQLRVYEDPVAGEEYFLAADVASGLEHGDNSAACVVNRKTNRIVAEWFGKIDAIVFALELYHLGHWYNWATIAIEVNFNMATQTELVDRLRYPNPYVWRVEDNLNGGYTNKIGWITNQRTRVALIDDMAFGLKQKMIGIPSVRIIDQLLTFDATAHESDDAAIACMIAWHCHLRSRMKDGFFPRQTVAPDVAPEADPYRDAPSASARAAWKDRDLMLKGAQRDQGSALVNDVAETRATSGYDRDPWPELD